MPLMRSKHVTRHAYRRQMRLEALRIAMRMQELDEVKARKFVSYGGDMFASERQTPSLPPIKPMPIVTW